MKSLLLLAIGIFLSVSVSAQPPELNGESESLRTVRSELSASGGIFFALGASNTGGFGLRFGMRDRILHHLVSQHPEAIQALVLKKQSVGILLDRFFPTAFPLFADPNVTDDNLRLAVIAVIEPLLKNDRLLVIAELFDPSSLRPERQAVVDKTSPLKHLAQALKVADPTGHHTKIVNQTLGELAKMEPLKIKLVKFNDLIFPFADPANPLALNLAELFQNNGNDVHINYSGQAFFFNVFVLPSLEETSGTTISPIKFQTTYSIPWEDEVIRSAAKLSPHEIGDAKVINAEALSADTHRITGTEKKGVMVKDGDLPLVDQAIRKSIGVPSASFAISRHRASNGERVYELDLTKQAYTKIELKESSTRPGVFIGMGSDYWGAAIGVSRYWSPALTNYIFVLTEIDDSHVDVEWKVLPQLVVGGKTQQIPKERKAVIVDPEKIWVPEIQKNIKAYNRLEYSIKTQIEWLRK